MPLSKIKLPPESVDKSWDMYGVSRLRVIITGIKLIGYLLFYEDLYRVITTLSRIAVTYGL
jgi:hypothetical protein